ncbi:MAG: endonuclease MutS2, partial [Myxococcales bacterium]|nr:endonuclease MutS2 [Myxococcales bacterium]
TPATAPATAREDLAPTRTPDLTLDVRGERVDDALARLDRFLDDALLGSREAVFVIHGHGTGALRDAVRRHADGHMGVSRLRPGAPRDGGDGVTVIWLDA